MKLLENGWIVELADNRSEIHKISIGKMSYEYSPNKQLMGISKNPNFVQTLCCSRLVLFGTLSFLRHPYVIDSIVDCAKHKSFQAFAFSGRARNK